MKKTILSLVSMAFICAMTLTSCNELVSSMDNPVSSYVQFPKSELTILPGQVVQNAATTISTENITYESSDEEVVKVDQNGNITAVAYSGKATITASVKATEYYKAGSATCTVTIGSVLAAALEEGAIIEFAAKLGANTFTPKFKKEGDNYVLQNPITGLDLALTYDAKDNDLTLACSTYGNRIFTVYMDVDTNSYQAYNETTTTDIKLTAIMINDKDVTSQLEEVVTPVNYLEIYLGGSMVEGPIYWAADAYVTFTAYAYPFYATDKYVTWTSSNTDVATVNTSGTVHTVAAGKTTIKAKTSNGTETSFELNVMDGPKTITLVPGVWDVDGARFAAYVWNAITYQVQWYLFSKVSDVWTATIPASYTGLVLVRLDSGTEVNWDHKWNQTDDIDFTSIANNTEFTITGWGPYGGNDPYTHN